MAKPVKFNIDKGNKELKKALDKKKEMSEKRNKEINIIHYRGCIISNYCYAGVDTDEINTKSGIKIPKIWVNGITIKSAEWTLGGRKLIIVT